MMRRLPPYQGTASYRDIGFGSHVLGEYRLSHDRKAASLSLLVHRPLAADGPLTVTFASEDNRFQGSATSVGLSLAIEGTGLPMVRAEDGFIPPGTPLHLETLTIHQLNDGVWVLVALRTSQEGDRVRADKNEVWHFRRKERLEPARRRTPPSPHPDVADTRQASRLADLDGLLAAVEGELAAKRAELEGVNGQIDDLRTDLEFKETDVLDLEFDTCDLPHPPGSPKRIGDELPKPSWSEIGEIQNGYVEIADLIGQIHDLRAEAEEAADEIDDLERQQQEIEDRLDRGHSAWVDEQARRAEDLAAQVPAPPAPPPELFPSRALAYLSDDVRTMVRTFHMVKRFLQDEPDSASVDWGMLVGVMAKTCERILSDFLEPRCRRLMGDAALVGLLTDPKHPVNIPEVDQQFKVDKASVNQVLSRLRKPDPVHWSGTRNAAIALMVLGRRFQVRDDPGGEVNNPLNLFGTEDQRAALRADLYRFQQLRNGYIHHDVADPTQAAAVMAHFTSGLPKLWFILFGISES